MKVQYMLAKTVITLDDKDQRQAVFDALRFYEVKHDYRGKIEGSIVCKLLNEWMREARNDS